MSDGSGKGYHQPPPITATPKRSILKQAAGKTDEPDAATAPEAHHTCPIGSPPPRANFDEMNIIQTLHPSGKDYGHMKIDEPKTPYNGAVGSDAAGTSQPPSGGIDPSALAASLNSALLTPPRVLQDLSQSELSDDEDDSPPHNTSFENQRKGHYNEYHVLQAARQKMTLPPGAQDPPPSLPFNDERLRNSAGEYRRGIPRSFEIVKYKPLKEKIAQGKRLSFAEKRRVHDSEYAISRRLGRHTLAFFGGMDHKTPGEKNDQCQSSEEKVGKASPLTFKKRRHIYDRNTIMKAIIELTGEMRIESQDKCQSQRGPPAVNENFKSKTPKAIPNFFKDGDNGKSPREKISKGQDFPSLSNEEHGILPKIGQSRKTVPTFDFGVKESVDEKIAKGKDLTFDERRDLHYRGEYNRGKNHFYGGKPYKLPPTSPPPIGHSLSFVERRDLEIYDEFTRAARHHPTCAI